MVEDVSLRHVFEIRLQDDRSNVILPEDAVELFVSLGLGEEESQHAVSATSSGSAKTRSLSFADFVAAFGAATENNEAAKDVLQLKELFESADRDGDGNLNHLDMLTLLQKLGVRPMPGEEMEKMCATFDVSGRGMLNFLEFVQAVSALRLGRNPEEEAAAVLEPPLPRWRASMKWLGGFASSARRASWPQRKAVGDAQQRLKEHLLKKHESLVWVASQRFIDHEQSQMRHFWRVLITTAMLQSLLSFTIDKFTFVLGRVRAQFTTGHGVDLVIVTIFNVLLVVVARLVVRSHQDAQGSGFPEVKAMLFGKLLPQFLTLRVLAAKAVSLALVVGAGLPIGKEGPNVHMAACFSASLGPEFYRAQDDSRKRIYTQRLLLAACAVGVGTTFSAPVGGVIFAIEFMLPQILDAISFWGSFVAAAVGSLCYAMLRAATSGGSALLPMMSTNVQAGEGEPKRHPFLVVFFSSILGLLCGLLAGVWIHMHTIINRRLKQWRLKGSSPAAAPGSQPALPSKKDFSTSSLLDRLRSHHTLGAAFEYRDLVMVAAITVINTLVAGALPILGGKPEPVLISMLFDKNLDSSDAADLGLPGGSFSTLLLCFVAKWFTTALALSLPTPTGAVAPTMIIGGLLGRVFVMLMPSDLRDFLLSNEDGSAVTDDQRGAFMARFAIVGACAFSSGVTRTFAMTITIFEALALPGVEMSLSISTLLSIWVANNVSLPFFDMNLVGRGLLGIPAITSSKRRLRPVFSIMRRIMPGQCATVVTTVRDLRTLLATTDEDLFPIVHMSEATEVKASLDPAAVRLAGSATRYALQHILDDLDPKFSNPDMAVDLLDPIHQEAQLEHELVQCCPLQVHADTTLRDVYIIMKATAENALFVTSNGLLVGVVYFSELLDGARMQA